ncbi:MAG: hypothetical protein IIY16_07585, partial [Oscillospiraceae bacterium]|nr:hypothetical protein [Oscillospiraceae bacterium]
MLELTASRRDAMAFTAMSAPTALLLGGKGMLWALPGIAAAALLYAVCARNLKDGAALAQRLPKWILAAEVAFLVAAMAKAASLASLCWSAAGTWPLFSLALLGLAAAGCAYGAEAASRSAAVLTWVCVVFFVILLLPASVKSEWAVAAGTPSDGMAVFAVMLCGMCALMLPARGSGAVGRLWVGMAALVLAVLFVSRGKPGAVPLLTAVKGAELLGTLQRYEAFASCAITIGLY